MWKQRSILWIFRNRFSLIDLNKLVKRRRGMGEKNIYVTPSFLNNISQEIAYTD